MYHVPDYDEAALTTTTSATPASHFISNDAKYLDAAVLACQQAAGVPRAIAEACDRTIQLAAELCDIGNPNLISDVGCAVRLAEAARHCAWLNVAINLSFIKDEAFKQEMTEALDEPGRESHRLAEETWGKVVKAVCG